MERQPHGCFHSVLIFFQRWLVILYTDHEPDGMIEAALAVGHSPVLDRRLVKLACSG
jgi:hypothetical protein